MSPLNPFRKKRPAAEASEEMVAPGSAGEEEPKAGLLGKLRTGLEKTRAKVAGGLRGVLSVHRS
ncbi:MAG: hypothetical protein ACYS8L_02550, partial [Planctomycetota bacterium]